MPTAPKYWMLSDGTRGTAPEMVRDERNIYGLRRSAIWERLKKGMRDPEDIFAPLRGKIPRPYDPFDFSTYRVIPGTERRKPEKPKPRASWGTINLTPGAK